jgi:16S rRNA G1207 methylase RsmC
MLHNLRLSRIPKDNQLQAWNAADELLLKRHNEIQGKTLLINDSFGALALSLNSHEIHWWNDSATSFEALTLNAQINNLPMPDLVTPPLNQQYFDTIIIQIPKSVNYFAWQLEIIKPQLNKGATVLALGMTKHISAAHIKAMKDRFHQVNPGRAEKKARVISLSEPNDQVIPAKNGKYNNPLTNEEIIVLPGCFAEKNIDPGARAFIAYFESLPKVKKVLDLGCGNGILSQAFTSIQPDTEVHLTDDSQQALESAKLNLSNKMNCFFYHSNGLNRVNTARFDLILCNPPFHQSTTITESIAQKMITDAAENLSENGELWLVANRHLDYRKTLKRHFHSIKIVSKEARFNVIQCQKLTT